jgi:hypothetical protein
MKYVHRGLAIVGLAVATLVGGGTLASVEAQGRLESRSVIGAFVPTGDHGDELDGALMMGSSLAFRTSETLSLVGRLTWSGSNAKQLSGSPEVKVYSYDLGAEYRVADVAAGRSWRLRPFVGGGVGGRTYNADVSGMKNETDFVGYGALGIQADYKKIGVRIEGRDYLSRYDGLSGTDDRATRNDIGISAGLAFRF